MDMGWVRAKGKDEGEREYLTVRLVGKMKEWRKRKVQQVSVRKRQKKG